MKQGEMATITAVETVSIAVESMVTVKAMVPRIDDIAVAKGNNGICPVEAASKVSVVMRGT